jgi:hypothetical protein
MELEREMLAQPVRSLQYMLRRLSRAYPFLPELALDGIFGPETLEAVMLFQRELHPPVTGVVDLGTWNAMRDRWLTLEEQQGDPRALRAFPGEGIRVEPGETREFMVLPQTMFQVLARYFRGIAPAAADGFHGPVSVGNVRWLQRRGGLAESGVLDRQTWGLLSRLYEVFVVKELEDVWPKFVQGWG